MFNFVGSIYLQMHMTFNEFHEKFIDVRILQNMLYIITQ